MESVDKIIVIGCGGAGKSTFSRKLSNKLDIPVYHLDKLFWNKGWIETPQKEFNKNVIFRNDYFNYFIINLGLFNWF